MVLKFVIAGTDQKRLQGVLSRISFGELCRCVQQIKNR